MQTMVPVPVPAVDVQLVRPKSAPLLLPTPFARIWLLAFESEPDTTSPHCAEALLSNQTVSVPAVSEQPPVAWSLFCEPSMKTVYDVI